MVVIVSSRRRASGYALLLVLTFLAVGTILLAGVLSWTSHEAMMTRRHNVYNCCVSAAEAATELVIAQMDRDFIFQSVKSDLNEYRSLVPDAIQQTWPVQFQFNNGLGEDNETGVVSLGPAVVTNLNSQFAGLYGLVQPYRIISRATASAGSHSVSATVKQDIELASIPIFQFAIFYGIDLEINPGAPMIVTGKVHSNGDIYTAPPSPLTFKDSVTAVGSIIPHRNPHDPQGDGGAKPVYEKDRLDKVSALTLPIGLEANQPEEIREILEPPPVGEDPNSALAKQRYYNRADLIIVTTDNGVTMKTGAWNGFAAVPHDITNGNVKSYSFLDPSASFNDLRETKWTITSQLDVAAFKAWLANPQKGGPVNANAINFLGHQINSIYIDDQRTHPAKLTTVRVVNGSELPADGLTIATPLPLYVKGHFNLNAGDTTPGLTTTSATKPASLVGDSITVLSGSWSDDNAGKSLNQRVASNTTLNAALMAGIVKSTTTIQNQKQYSGGVENFIRFLENWSGKTMTYNGSMVVLFSSEYATGFWKAPGNYYNAPTRKWSFDVNFLQQSKLPPATQQVRKLVRGEWEIVAGNQ